MRLYEDENCQLLLAVYPAFVKALPDLSARAIQWLDLETLTSARRLSDEVKQIGMNFTKEDACCDIDDDAGDRTRNEIIRVLYFFESCVKSREDQASSDESDFPRLNSLRREMLDTKKPLLTDTKCVSFGNDRRAYNRAFFELTGFNYHIRSMWLQPGTEDTETPSHLRTGPSPSQMSESRALRLSAASGKFFKLLETATCKKDATLHQGHLRLPELHHPELEMLLSVCAAKRNNCWQQVYVNLEENESQGNQEIREICPQLETMRRIPRPIRMVLAEAGLQKIDSKGYTSMLTLPPLNTRLSAILSQGEDNWKIPEHYSPLKHNTLRELGTSIATAFFNLFNVPHLRSQVLDPNFIHVLKGQSTSDGNGSNPWRACVSFNIRHGSAQQEDYENGYTPSEEADEESDMLALAGILVGLELKREVKPSENDLDPISLEPSMYYALKRHYKTLEDGGDKDFYILEAVRNCLELDGDLQENSIGTGIQQALFTRIVKPLTERLNCIRGPIPRRPPEIRPSMLRSPAADSRRTPNMSRPGTRSTVHAKRPESVRRDPGPFVTTNCDPIIPSDARPLVGPSSDSKGWMQQFDDIHLHLKEEKDIDRSQVRIAILDTGCDVESDCIISLGNAEARLVGHWEDWAGLRSSEDPIDDDETKHGTQMVALLMRIAPHAEVFVGRIAKSQGDLNEATKAIVKGIRHAATNWDVDIITMSFGLIEEDCEVSNVIARVSLERKEQNRGILFFAASNNSGLNEPERFPASDPNVISVRGTNYTGEFMSKYNPKSWGDKERQMRFGTLGFEVPYDKGDVSARASGCSVATPILAGIVAAIMQYVEVTWPDDEDIKRHLRTMRGIQALMTEIGKRRENAPHETYVAPGHFFLDLSNDKAKRTKLDHSRLSLQRSNQKRSR